MDAVAITGLLVAALRAEETRRADRLFEDRFAEQLAGPVGHATLARYRAASSARPVPIIEVRTRWYDEALARAGQAGIRQFVILAAGMDARAFRLAWPAGASVFEIDRPEVIAAKARVLDGPPRCKRVAIGADLASDWGERLVAEGLDRGARTAWLVEGLLLYLEQPVVERLFERIAALATSGSVVLFDVVGKTLLESPVLEPTLAMMKELGAPWRFGSDDPAALVPGWDAAITDPAVVGNAWGRWPFPAAPAGTPGVPRGYLVEATKRSA